MANSVLCVKCVKRIHGRCAIQAGWRVGVGEIAARVG